MKGVWLVAAGFALALGTIIFFKLHTKYVQTDCEIDPAHGAAIWMRDSRTTDHSRDSAHMFNIEFQPDGIVMRFPPQFFVLDWEDVAAVELSDRRGSTGLLKLRMKYKSGTDVIDVGTVQQACWSSVENYLHNHLKR